MRSIKRLLGDTKNVILAAGALAGAVVAVYSAGNTIQSIWDGSSSNPVPNNANIKEAKVEPGVLLEQYEYINQPGATGSASDGSRPRAADYELAADTTPAHTRAAIVIAAAVSDGAGTSATSSTTSTATGSGENPGSGNQQGTAKEETPEEKEAKKKAGEAKEKEEIKLKEETKAEEETKETKAKEVKAKEEAKAAKEAKARAAAKLKAEAKVVEEEKKEKEEHERKEVKGSPTHGSESAGHNGQGDEHEYPTYVPPPSPTSFHREGDARVLIGTGAHTNEVNAVLSKVKAILDADNADASTGNGVFNDAVFDDAGGNSAELNDTGPNNAELHNTRLNNTGLNNAGLNEGGLSEGGPTTISETSAGDTTRAPALPLHCGPKCALRPAIDQAIYDSYSNLAQAAKTIAADFAESRVRVFEHKPRPVGVTVDYTLDLIGYAKRRLALEWTLYSKSTGLPLPRTWWHNVIVKQIEPSGPTTHIASNFWAPIPPANGDYYFKLRVFASETEESAHAVTAEFH